MEHSLTSPDVSPVSGLPDLRPPTSDLQPSNIGNQRSEARSSDTPVAELDLRPPTSDLCPSTPVAGPSHLRPPTSGGEAAAPTLSEIRAQSSEISKPNGAGFQPASDTPGSPPTSELRPPTSDLSSACAASFVSEYFGRLSTSFGLSRSVGSIFSCLFLSPQPLCFADIVDTAAVSKASASFGLRLLQQLHAVETVLVSGDRRKFYRAETSVRRLISGLLNGTILSQLDAGDRLLDAADIAANGQDHLQQRISSLRSWQKGARDLLPFLHRLSLG